MRRIPLAEVQANEDYADLGNLAEALRHEIIEDDHGTWRFAESRLVTHLRDGAAFYTPPASVAMYGRNSVSQVGSIDLNGLSVAFARGAFSMAEYMKFYMGLGYSLCGFAEVFDDEDIASVLEATDAAP